MAYTARRALRATIALSASALMLTACTNSETPAGSSDASAASASNSAAADFSPAKLENCGFEVDVDKQPTKVLTLNQGATETVLALGAADQLAGTAYLDDEVAEKYKADYDKVPVLAEKYPSHEAILEAKPDLVVASFASAFKDDVAGPRQTLEDLGVDSYLDPFACEDKALRAPAKWDSITSEITQLGEILGRSEKAKELNAGIEKDVKEIEAAAPAKGKTVFWWDSGTDTPFVGAGTGGPQLILDTVGATNIFKDLPGNWADGSWETVLQANPDYIVLADASWDTAEQKKEWIKNDPSLKDLDAVKNDRFLVVKFSESTPGVRTIDAAKTLSAGFKDAK